VSANDDADAAGKEMEAMEGEPKRLISLEDLVVKGSLQRGELQPIADYYRKHGGLPSHIMEALIQTIDGSAEDTSGWRLALVKHPDIPRLTHGRRAEMRKRKEFVVRTLMGPFGAQEPGGYDAAVSETAAFLKLSSARVRQIWDGYLREEKRRTPKPKDSDT